MLGLDNKIRIKIKCDTTCTLTLIIVPKLTLMRNIVRRLTVNYTYRQTRGETLLRCGIHYRSTTAGARCHQTATLMYLIVVNTTKFITFIRFTFKKLVRQ
jgi:hypothetical protein